MEVIEREFKEEALTLKGQATAIKVRDVETYASAGELGKAMKELRSKVVEYFAPLKDAAHKAHKAITAKEAEELKPIDEAITILRSTMNAFTAEQERLRRIEEDKLRKIEEERAAKEREKLLAQAVKAEAKGNGDKAEELLEKAENVYVAPVTVEPTVAKTVKTAAGNITQASETIITVTNLKDFIAELVKRGLAPTMLDVKAMALKQWVKANGFESFPGLAIKKQSSARF